MMGMYDNVIIDYPLPNDEHLKCSGWQTKDFECNLDTYLIREDGVLCLKGFDRDSREFTPVDYSGIIWVYTYSEDRYKDKSTEHLFVEFKLEIEKGKVLPESVTTWPADISCDEGDFVEWSEEDQKEFFKRVMLALSQSCNYRSLARSLFKITPLKEKG